MAHQPDEELRALRERAYGPTADIYEDAAALRRLRELEDHAHDAAPGGDGAPPHEHPEPVEPAEPHAGAWEDAPHEEAPTDRAWTREDDDLPTAGSGGEAQSPTSLRHEDAAFAASPVVPPTPSTSRATTRPRGFSWLRRSTVLWLTGLIVTAIVSAGVTLWAVRDGGRIAVLQPTDPADWPDNVLGDPPEGSRLFDEFLGLTVVAMPQSWGSGAGMDCLYVLESGEDGFMTTIGCAAGVFSPAAALSVSERAPDELRERFADGTALQFVLNGDHVNVYVDEP